MQDRELWVISLVLVSSLSFFSSVNVCDWAFQTGLISHLSTLMGAEGNWWVNCVTFTSQTFDLRPTFRCGGMMWNSIPHTHRSHATTSQMVTHSLLVTMPEISLTVCGCGPEFLHEIWYWIEPVTAFWNVKYLGSADDFERESRGMLIFPRCLALIASSSCTCSV